MRILHTWLGSFVVEEQWQGAAGGVGGELQPVATPPGAPHWIQHGLRSDISTESDSDSDLDARPMAMTELVSIFEGVRPKCWRQMKQKKSE